MRVNIQKYVGSIFKLSPDSNHVSSPVQLSPWPEISQNLWGY